MTIMTNGELMGASAQPTTNMKMKLIQINADRKGATNDVIIRRARRDGTDVLILSEPTKKLCIKN